MSKEFKRGEVVIITDKDWVFPTYDTFSLLKNVDNWERNREPKQDQNATIIDFGLNESNPGHNGMIYLVEQDNYTYIMSPKGFESAGYTCAVEKSVEQKTKQTGSSMWNCKCRKCGHDAYDSGFSYQCSKECC